MGRFYIPGFTSRRHPVRAVSFLSTPAASTGFFKSMLYFLQTCDMMLVDGRTANAEVFKFVLSVFNLELSAGGGAASASGG